MLRRTARRAALLAAAAAACLGAAAAPAGAQGPVPNDLTIQGYSISPSSPMKNQEVTVTITVANDGPAAVRGSWVSFKATPSTAVPAYAYVPGMAAGTARSVTLKARYRQAGTFTSVVKIDVFNQIDEPFSGEDNNWAQQQVTVGSNATPVDVDIHHLHVFNDLDDAFLNTDGEWDDIVLAVFDPASSCRLKIDRGPVHIDQTIPSVACMSGGDGSVNDGDDPDIQPYLGLRVRLEPGLPVVAAVSAFENDDPLAPDVPGYATFVSLYPAYRSLEGPQLRQGKGCTKISTTGTPEPASGGHCFDAYFTVHLPLGVAPQPAGAGGMGAVAAEQEARLARTFQALRDKVQRQGATAAGDLQVVATTTPTQN